MAVTGTFVDHNSMDPSKITKVEATEWNELQK